MQYYRCKCGKREVGGSMGPAPCSGCKECGTIPGLYAGEHRAPMPHRLHAHKVETDAGSATLSRCTWCLRTKADIEKAGEPIEPQAEGGAQ